MALVTCNFVPFLLTPDQKGWNKIIKKQVLQRNVRQAIHSYIDMQESGFFADNFTFPILLKVSNFCGGLQLHAQAIKSGFSEHVYVQTALMGLYSDFGQIDNAHKVFEKMFVKDLVAWNSMLDAYVSNGQIGIAMELFDSMSIKDVSSYNIVVSGLAAGKRIKSARNLFDEMPVRDVVSWNSMILACINAGDMAEARALFKEAPWKNVITWNTMIMGCVNYQLYTEALELFCEMKAANVEPDYLTVTGALSACANLRSLEAGMKVDVYARNHGQALSPHVVTALIDMYAKCGSIMYALEVFYKSPDADIYCWNAMISGLALHGYGNSALKLFDEMRERSVKPDDITFIGLLSACSHAGLVKEGCQLFGSMERDFGIVPKIEHYGCMVDLLSRAKLLDRAFRFVKTVPFEPGESIFGSLLGACVIHQDLQTGEEVIKLIREKANNRLSDGEFMTFSNLYASCGQWEESNKWRSMMNDSGIVKTAGCSTIEVNGKFHKFLAGEVLTKNNWASCCLY